MSTLHAGFRLMNPEPQCPRCGRTLRQDAPAGHCPDCLVQLALQAVAAPTEIPADEANSRPAAPEPVTSAGSRVKYFGDYELLGEIARGGMGVVWKARQVSLNRPVALKMILAGRFAGEADVRRFHTEAEAAANLQHPNIVAIHEIGQFDGQQYFSMDYIEGRNLAELVSDGPLPAPQAAALVKRIAEAVHYAHQRGTLHRDLKPSNVLIDAEGQPRITDFGLAKQLSGDSNLTQTGAVLGTPAYMPPEQAAGRKEQVGPASDVYSMGAMLYHLLTGRAPFAGETPTATMRQAMEEEPVAPSKSNPKTPPDLETICLKCLEKRPDRRYHSARELAEELGRFLDHEPILAHPASAWRKVWTWSSRNPWAWIGVAAMIANVLLCLAYGLWVRVKFLEAGSPPQGVRFDPVPILVGMWVLFPALFFGRWLQGRRSRNLPVGGLQLAILAGSGLCLIATGFWSDMMLIRNYVWGGAQSAPRGLHFNLPGVVGACLGSPLVYCWVGSLLIWQAVRGQQALWSGSATAAEEWLPRQPVRYSSLAFIAATFANLAWFGLVVLVGLETRIFDGVLAVVGFSRAGRILLVTCFIMIAFVVSNGFWVYTTRKVCQRHPLVSVLLTFLFGGVAITWFSAPPYSDLPAGFVLAAMLAGLAGGWVLVKWVKIGQANPTKPVAPLALGKLLQCDRKAFVISLAVVLIVLGFHERLFYGRETELPTWTDYFLVMFQTGWNALLPFVFLAVRAASGKERELLLSLLLLMVGFVVLFPLAALGLPLAERPGAKSAILLHNLAVVLTGNAVGCALIYFGRIRPQPRPQAPPIGGPRPGQS